MLRPSPKADRSWWLAQFVADPEHRLAPSLERTLVAASRILLEKALLLRPAATYVDKQSRDGAERRLRCGREVGFLGSTSMIHEQDWHSGILMPDAVG